MTCKLAVVVRVYLNVKVKSKLKHPEDASYDYLNSSGSAGHGFISNLFDYSKVGYMRICSFIPQPHKINNFCTF